MYSFYAPLLNLTKMSKKVKKDRALDVAVRFDMKTSKFYIILARRHGSVRICAIEVSYRGAEHVCKTHGIEVTTGPHL